MKKPYYYTALLIAVLALFGQAKPTLAAEAITDGSFEDFLDPYPWQCTNLCTLAGADYYAIYDPSVAYDGSYIGYIFHQAQLYQAVTIPSNATTISFVYQNQLADDGVTNGSFSVSLTDSTLTTVYATQSYASPADDVWLSGTLTIPGSLQGQTVNLLLANEAGYNRIDYLQFKTAADQLAELQQLYPTVKLHVLSASGNAVKNAVVFVKQHGVRLDLMNTTTLVTSTKLTTNKKGRTPKFMIAQTLAAGETVKVCAKKNTITECSTISPATGMDTSYDFSFASKKVTAL